LQACSQRRVLPEDVQEYLQSASERANIPRGTALADDETDADLAISRQLYDHYMTYCEDEPAPEAVIRLMASLARN
jgi:hypothetical protein